MDYAQVNDVLSRANMEFERRELEDLQGYELEADMVEAPADDIEEAEVPTPAPVSEMYVGTGGTEPPHFNPPGDPLRGSDAGVDNLASDVEGFLGFIADCASSIAAQLQVSEDEALKAVYDTADELADKGEMPPLPDLEEASPEEISGWTGKAKTCDLMARAVEAIKAARGQSPLHGPGGQ